MRFDNPKILGIVNITEDSFSDGGVYLDPEKALAHAVGLLEDGADIIDLGAASSNPESKPVPPHQEQQRLQPIIAELKGRDARISVDSYAPATQRFALQQKVDYLNDIQGFPEPEIYPDLAAADCQLILMHSVQRIGKAQKRHTDPQEIMTTVARFFEERTKALEDAGIRRERIIIDPGMGFFLGSNPEPSVEALRNIGNLKREFGFPVLISVSRKSFLRTMTNRPTESVGPATLAAELYAALQGVDFIRTHDVRALTDGLKILQALS